APSDLLLRHGGTYADVTLPQLLDLHRHRALLHFLLQLVRRLTERQDHQRVARNPARKGADRGHDRGSALQLKVLGLAASAREVRLSHVSGPNARAQKRRDERLEPPRMGEPAAALGERKLAGAPL